MSTSKSKLLLALAIADVKTPAGLREAANKFDFAESFQEIPPAGRNQWIAVDGTSQGGSAATLNAFNIGSLTFTNHSTHGVFGGVDGRGAGGIGRSTYAALPCLALIYKHEDDPFSYSSPSAGHGGDYMRRGRFIPEGASYWKEVWSLPRGTSGAPNTYDSRTEIACTPNVPIDFNVPPLGQTWFIADTALDLDSVNAGKLATKQKRGWAAEYALATLVSDNLPRSQIDFIVSEHDVDSMSNPVSEHQLLKAIKRVHISP